MVRSYQIGKKLAVAQHAESGVSNALEGNSSAKLFADRLLNSSRLTDMIELSDNVSFFGPLRPLSAEVDKIENFPHERENMTTSQRMTKHGESYHSISYLNFVCSLQPGISIMFRSLLWFK